MSIFKRGGVLPVSDMNEPIMEDITEVCGNKMRVDITKFVPFHAQYYRIEDLETKDKIIKRTFCDTCVVYWDKEYKKIVPKRGKRR